MVAASDGSSSTGQRVQGSADADGNLGLDDVTLGRKAVHHGRSRSQHLYIVIDRMNGENVYFLNLVDEADLMALMQTARLRSNAPVPTAVKPVMWT